MRRGGALTFACVVVLLALAVAAAGCDMPSTGGLGRVTGSGTPQTKTFDLAGFTKVRADYGFDVQVTRADAYGVTVTVDDNLVRELRVSKEGDTLVIGMNDQYTVYDRATLKATVTMPRLTGVEVSGAAGVAASGFASGDPLDVAASGAGVVKLSGVRAGKVGMQVSGGARLEGDLEAEELSGEVSGGGLVTLNGSAARLRAEASGAGELGLGGMTVQDADLRLSGGAKGKVTVTGTLNVQASGGATLDYAGSPQLGTVDTSGGATVNAAQP